jgi:chromatin remodeling complex protein RSC6
MVYMPTIKNKSVNKSDNIIIKSVNNPDLKQEPKKRKRAPKKTTTIEKKTTTIEKKTTTNDKKNTKSTAKLESEAKITFNEKNNLVESITSETDSITSDNTQIKTIKGNKDTSLSVPQKNTKTRRVINMQTIEESLLRIEEELIKERNNVNNLLKLIVDVRKDYGRLSKEITKKGRKKNDSADKKKLSGALGPIFLDDELCQFLGKPSGTKMNAPEVIKALNVYIVENKLQVDNNKTIISPDDKLASLLKVNDEEQLTYFNIQKYLSKHYIKNKNN